MINVIRRAARTARTAVLSVAAPARLFTGDAPAVAEPVAVPDPAGVYTEADMPELADIEAAAVQYEAATIEARRADRGKRAARKVLDISSPHAPRTDKEL